jgi:hypothetical protein
MVTTPDAILLAAKRWLVELEQREPNLARITFRTAARFRDITPTQYESALIWLQQHGLVDIGGALATASVSPGLQVLRAALQESKPIWLANADELIPDSSALPLDLLELGSLIGLGELDLHDEVLRAWRQFDDSAQAALGIAGELAMSSWLMKHTMAEVVQFAGQDDSVGFDFALRIDQRIVARIEVKATRRPNNVVFYLSRNEYRVMLKRQNWCLQLIQLDADGAISSLLWAPKEKLVGWAPKDGEEGVWQSMRLDLPLETLEHGPAPELRPFLRDLA